MKKKPLHFIAIAIFIELGFPLLAFANPVISTSSACPIKISSARVERTRGDFAYVTGMVEPSVGYSSPGMVSIHVFAYGTNGKLLAEKIERINFSRLVRWHLHPRPSAPYVAFFPWSVSKIAKVAVIEGRG